MTDNLSIKVGTLTISTWLDYLFTIPIRTVPLSNSRPAHWSQRHRHVKAERKATWAAALRAKLEKLKPWETATVTMRRVSRGTLDDDNLPVALKAVRDQLAEHLGLPHDADPRVKWVVEQERRVARACVEVHIRVEGVTR